nr:atherin-like [Malus domestica]
MQTHKWLCCRISAETNRGWANINKQIQSQPLSHRNSSLLLPLPPSRPPPSNPASATHQLRPPPPSNPASATHQLRPPPPSLSNPASATHQVIYPPPPPALSNPVSEARRGPHDLDQTVWDRDPGRKAETPGRNERGWCWGFRDLGEQQRYENELSLSLTERERKIELAEAVARRQAGRSSRSQAGRQAEADASRQSGDQVAKADAEMQGGGAEVVTESANPLGANPEPQNQMYKYNLVE